MADRELLFGEFTAKFQPASAFTTTLEEMMKFNTWGLLTVNGTNKFQIKTEVSQTANHMRLEPAVFSLEMEADPLLVTFNNGRYCLHFSLLDWYERIKNPILENPSSSMTIKKSFGSLDLHCLLGEDNQLINLGEAQFVTRIPIQPCNPHLYVKVTMEGACFRAILQGFSSKHDHSVSKVQLHVTHSTLTWITPKGNFSYSVKGFVKEVVLPDGVTSFQFGVWWDLDMFEKHCSASKALGCDNVELTVFDNVLNKRFYRFRFLHTAKSYYHIYEERVLLQ